MSESHVRNESLDTLSCVYLRHLQSGSEVSQKWYFVSKIVLTFCENKNVTEKNCANILRSLEQSIQTLKGQNNL